MMSNDESPQSLSSTLISSIQMLDNLAFGLFLHVHDLKCVDIESWENFLACVFACICVCLCLRVCVCNSGERRYVRLISGPQPALVRS